MTDTAAPPTCALPNTPLAAAVPGAKLIVLPSVGHMVQNAVPDLVVSEIEQMIAGLR